MLMKYRGALPVRYRVLGLAVLLAGITYLDRVCISLTAPAMMRELGLSKVEMSLVFSAFTLAYALFEIPTGWWGDRIGTRRVLTRIVIGVEIGGVEDELFDEGFDLAQDIIRAGFRTPDDEPEVPTSVRLDTSMVLRDLEDFEVEGDCDEDDEDDGSVTVCDVPDCPVHKPVPTDYEA